MDIYINIVTKECYFNSYDFFLPFIIFLIKINYFFIIYGKIFFLDLFVWSQFVHVRNLSVSLSFILTTNDKVEY